jgi:TonB-linked SusC/RagA family outer membrane protein
MKKILLFCAVSMMAISVSWAQRTVTGTVTGEEDGTPVPGVNVIVKGTSGGTVTNIDGEYQISVPESGGTLVFSFIGLTTEEVEIGNQSVIDMVMTADIRQLTEVVVTALGVTRDKASLGYATQEVANEQLSTAKEQNFVNSLSGKVAGVQIRQNPNMGGSTNVLIRGNTSIGGNNQPLFVVDGIPIDNSTNNDARQRGGQRGYDYGNAASDINPDDIESLNVLKGAAATALYGSRAANGAIIITTKKGKAKKGIGVDFSTAYTAGNIDKSTFIRYQDQYGAGYGPYYGGPDGKLNEYDANGDGVDDLVVPTTEDASFGSKFTDYAGTPIWQWDSFWPESENYGRPYEYKAGETTPVDFFQTMHTFNNSVALHGGDEKNTFRLGYTNFAQTGILPNSRIDKNNFSLSTTSQINSKLKADVSFNYINTRGNGRYSTGYSDNLMSQFRQWWQVNVDVAQLEELYNKSGGQNRTWNMNYPHMDPALADMTPIYWDNPYWTRYKNYNSDTRNRIIGQISLTYEFTDWLNLMGRVAIDDYREKREERRAIGSVPTRFGISGLDEGSGYDRKDIFTSEYNLDLLLTANKNISDDISFYGLLGANIRRNNYEFVQQSTLGGLIVPDLYSLSNSVLTPPNPVEIDRRKEVYGYFTNINIGFRNTLYLDGVFRYDISSALPVSNNSYPYGSVSLGWVFSENLNSSWLNLGKIRGSWATVGNDTQANRTTDVFVRNDNFGSAGLFSTSTTKGNNELVPERTNSFEIGLEGAAFNNRLRLDVTAYSTNTQNQIVTIATSLASGYGFKVVNGGEIENRGLELTLGGDIIRTGDFRWSLDINWTKNINEVISLPGIDNFVINSYQGGISTNVTVGQPYGVLRGTGFAYDDAGNRIVNSSGYYTSVPDQIIGDPNPDWYGGVYNTLAYKGLKLGFLIDISQGGDVYSLDMHYGQGTGLPDYTAANNELGNPVRDAVADGGGVLQEGVQEDGSENEVRARADYYGGVWYWGNSSRNPGQLTVYDASFVKLRELTLTYTFPQELVGGFARNVALSFVGRNLWIINKNLDFADPESGLGAGNGQGYLSGSYPTVRNLGFKLDFNF